MNRLTKRAIHSDMVWFVDETEKVDRIEPYEMNPHQVRVALEKLAEYEDACDENLCGINKLVSFPSVAWCIEQGRVYKGCVHEVVYSITRKPLFEIRYDDSSLASHRGYVGLTVFLTEDEANRKLEELKKIYGN